jgi:flavodoxin
MSALVVYESLYGNTRDVAAAIAEGLGQRFSVDLTEVGDAGSDLTDAELVVVGGPTHIHGMMSERSRQSVIGEAGDDEEESDLVSTGPILREWLDGLAPGRGVPAAAFDTRIDKSEWLTGAASKGISKRLRKRGFRVSLDRGSFLVEGTEGPLLDGEVDRAREWARRLAEHFVL